MQSVTAIAAACALLQHALMGCCWHHETCSHASGLPAVAQTHCHHAHTSDEAHRHAGTHPEAPHSPEHSHHGCTEGRCWWLADHDCPQPPGLDRMGDALVPVDSFCGSTPSLEAAATRLPHGPEVPSLPVRAHLWNQLFLL